MCIYTWWFVTYTTVLFCAIHFLKLALFSQILVLPITTSAENRNSPGNVDEKTTWLRIITRQEQGQEWPSLLVNDDTYIICQKFQFSQQKGSVIRSLAFLCYLAEQAVEETIVLSVIWNADMLVWRHHNGLLMVHFHTVVIPFTNID